MSPFDEYTIGLYHGLYIYIFISQYHFVVLICCFNSGDETHESAAEEFASLWKMIEKLRTDGVDIAFGDEDELEPTHFDVHVVICNDLKFTLTQFGLKGAAQPDTFCPNCKCDP